MPASNASLRKLRVSFMPSVALLDRLEGNSCFQCDVAVSTVIIKVCVIFVYMAKISCLFSLMVRNFQVRDEI